MFIKLGTFVIAERKSIKVSNLAIDITLRNEDKGGASGAAAQCLSGGDGSGGCVSPIQSKEIIFTLEFVGSVASNQSLYRALDDYMGDVCTSTPAQWFYRACDEEIEEETIVSAYMKRLEMDRERYGVRTAEVHLITKEFGSTEMLSFGLQFLPPSVTI